MTAYIAKEYQDQVLDSVKTYFQVCHEFANASTAFYVTTEQLWGKGQTYNALNGFNSEMPYFCLRVPTGGGKTWLASKSVALINKHFLRVAQSIILWLVPSKTIREQTITALKNKQHPYSSALREAGEVTVMDIEEAKSITRSTLLTSTVVIVATRQAFQVEEEESRKVYQNNGALMHHFEHLTAEQKSELLTEGEGSDLIVPNSLANVLRLHRPFIIVDEAHNSRTELAFDMLARFKPSGIMELTATPDTVRTPTNVLHSVSAAELKAEQMIKLPIVLETESNWQQCLAYAIHKRESLEHIALEEQRQGFEYLRPIVLIQAEAKSKVRETLDIYAVLNELENNQNIPREQIALATGDEKELEEITAKYLKGILDKACKIKYVITQKALAEGWDCPFAYILVSMASVQSSTAVEQLLGRILRQPNASHRKSEQLNQSYAYVVSKSFSDTAETLRDSLVEGAGFDTKEAAEFVKAGTGEQARLDFGNSKIIVKPITIPLPEKPDLKSVTPAVKKKVEWNNKTNELTIITPLTKEETVELTKTVSQLESVQQIKKGAEVSRQSIEYFQTPAELGKEFKVPLLALSVQGELQLFDDPEVLEYPWNLTTVDAKVLHDDISILNSAYASNDFGTLDIDETKGKVKVTFLPKLQRDLGLVYKPENWDEVKLATWLCKNILEESLTHEAKRNFVLAWLNDLLSKDDFDLARTNTQKYIIRQLIEKRINILRKEAVNDAYQNFLFGNDELHQITVSNEQEYQFNFHPNVYAPSRDDNGEYGYYAFNKHYYGRIGAFDSGEEFACACWLDQQAVKGKIEFWVRNLVRKEGCSFYLQKGNGRFYPDFICKLPDGKILVVEYKGADKWEAAKDDRQIGELWANLSEGKCKFIMIKDKRFDLIESLLN
ncbi:type III restriction enzyme [Acinetobacter baylyi]|uniref:Type III restriction enzyme n=1 Tax=Acinetobacter baylyi TaxID=202950 RepID=A0ABU0UWN0_ACIBI|nr:DEAD/DEAH box helicase family protein [Acinetobacter baylyi]MDQ1208967.1 type III restriction enzyme [Acinetobacter baylyi]MDR6107437.1 type III restriction enzyme [Acinetobacter baylyi]MDR6185841.1 type III restriction enzyme [Acinetobacter baylyi]